MKKLISSLLMFVMAFGINSAKADNISMEEARAAAAYFMNYYNKVEKWTPEDLTLVYQINNETLNIPASYFFNCAGAGWVIMAGTTTINPIIAYNIEGSLNPELFHDNMRWWVEGYSDMVSEIQMLDAENNYDDDPVWTALKNNNYKGDTKDQQHKLMIESWGQGNEYVPTYNRYCPVSTNGYTAVVGCVATAMSQIFHYYQFPKKGQGMAKYWLRRETDDETMPNVQLKYNFDDSAEFNYDMMPNRATDKYGNQVSSCSDEQMNEIAHLCYAAGVAVKMAYSPISSGASSYDVPDAAYNYFKYKKGYLVSRNGDGVDWAYVGAIRNNLMQSNVIYMSACSSTNQSGNDACHAWVCCGYKEEDTSSYYMNWGWDGSSNGWYNLGTNYMPISGQGYNFKLSQKFINGMVPDSSYLDIADVDGNSYLGKPYPNPAVSSVALPYSTENATDLVIYNIEGSPVATYRVQAGEGKLEVRVDALPAGLYIYRMNSLAGKFIVK